MILIDKKINFQVLDNLEEIKNKWLEVFAGNLTEKERIDELGMDAYLWHLFSYEKRECLEGNDARIAFDELRRREYYVFFDNHRYDYYDLSEYENKVFEVFDGNKAKAKDFNKEDDVYVVDKYFRWTYVNTHEGYCGPYFCKMN